MTLRPVNAKTARIDARVSADQKDLFQHAAFLSGTSLTDFIISAVQEVAKRTIQEHEVIQLTRRDQQTFVEVFFSPEQPNIHLIKAVKHYKKAVK